MLDLFLPDNKDNKDNKDDKNDKNDKNYKVRVDDSDIHGISPLMNTLSIGTRWCLEVLQHPQSNRFNVDGVDKVGRTMLHHLLSKCGDASNIGQCISELVINKKADVNKKDGYGFTPLHIAAGGEGSYCDAINLDVLKQLLCVEGIDPNIQSNDGLTPLHVAVLARNLDAVKTLIEKGVHLGIKNIYGHSAFDLALTWLQAVCDDKGSSEEDKNKALNIVKAFFLNLDKLELVNKQAILNTLDSAESLKDKMDRIKQLYAIPKPESIAASRNITLSSSKTWV